MAESDDRDLPSRVLMNAEEQYCLWPTGKDIPSGWTLAFEGSKSACLEYVERVWTDMRPKSLRDSIANEAVEADGNGR